MIASFSSGIPAFVRQLAVLRVNPFAKRIDFMLINGKCSSSGSLSKGNLLRVSSCLKQSPFKRLPGEFAPGSATAQPFGFVVAAVRGAADERKL
jgi:hypothetical protein